MAVHIIIDGYNVLKQALPNNEVSVAQRRAFINMLGKYAAKKNHKITVVFDGGPTIWQSQEKDHGINVIFSGVKQSADEVIKKYIEQKDGSFLIVTSDNEIKKAAGGQNIIAIPADEFYALVRQELQPQAKKPLKGALVKTSTEENPLLDSLMQYDNYHMPQSDEIDANYRHRKSKTFSKKERAYIQKIKKL